MMKKTGVTDVRPKEGTKAKKSPPSKQTITTRTLKQSMYEPLNKGTVKKLALKSLTTKTIQPSSHVSQESTSSRSSSSRKQPADMASKKGKEIFSLWMVRQFTVS